MSRHLHLVHTQFVCYWRCPVPVCPSWFTSELNGKDHIEHTHRFLEGRGHSFYECLRKFGLEWFGSRSLFDQRKGTGQSLWMDLALARCSGQELRNSYTITGSPGFAPLRKFFRVAIHQLHLLYTGVPDSRHPHNPMQWRIQDYEFRGGGIDIHRPKACVTKPQASRGEVWRGVSPLHG